MRQEIDPSGNGSRACDAKVKRVLYRTVYEMTPLKIVVFILKWLPDVPALGSAAGSLQENPLRKLNYTFRDNKKMHLNKIRTH